VSLKVDRRLNLKVNPKASLKVRMSLKVNPKVSLKVKLNLKADLKVSQKVRVNLNQSTQVWLHHIYVSTFNCHLNIAPFRKQ